MNPVGGSQSPPPATTAASAAAAVSSSLSPLAPPFTLERRLLSSTSSNHFTFWPDPSSSYHASSSFPREIYGGHVTVPDNRSGPPVLVSTGLYEVEPYSQLLTTSSEIEPSSGFLLNSPFRSIYTMDNIAAATCSGSGQVITSAKKTSSNGYCVSDAPYPMLNHNSIGGKLGPNENIQDDNSLKRSICISGRFGKGLHWSSKVASKGMTDNSTEVASGLKVKHLDPPKASASACGPVSSNDPKQNSVEIVDPLDLDVDSPCWKGALVSRQSPFSVDEHSSPYPIVKESESSNDLTTEQKHLSCSAIYSEPVAEQSSTLVCAKSDQKISASPIVSSSIISPRTKKKFEEASRINLDCASSCGKEISCADVGTEQRIEDKKRNTEVYYNDVTKSDPKDSCVSPDNLVLANQNIDPKQGPCSLRERNAQVLVKAIHSISKVLSGTICNGDNGKLVGQDHELLLVIDNLQALMHENKKWGIRLAAAADSTPEVLVKDTHWTRTLAQLFRGLWLDSGIQESLSKNTFYKEKPKAGVYKLSIDERIAISIEISNFTCSNED